MTRTYEIVGLADAHQAAYPDLDENCNPDDYGIWECVDGRPVRLLGTDGGDPEDQILVRNWAWVARELAIAYARGREDARQELT